MGNSPDFIHLFFDHFWRILKMYYPSLVWKWPLLCDFWKLLQIILLLTVPSVLVCGICEKISSSTSGQKSTHYCTGQEMAKASWINDRGYSIFFTTWLCRHEFSIKHAFFPHIKVWIGDISDKVYYFNEATSGRFSMSFSLSSF